VARQGITPTHSQQGADGDGRWAEGKCLAEGEDDGRNKNNNRVNENDELDDDEEEERRE
jgi:hypothetical protein